jgi:DNA-binding NtrC family response regulator
MPGNRRRRVLIVEDEAILAFVLEELLVDSGFEIAGIATRLETALSIIESGVCEAAVLDANLVGISAAPAALALTARGVPFIVLSGYSPDQLPKAFTTAICLQKPCQPDSLIQALLSILPGQESVKQ